MEADLLASPRLFAPDHERDDPPPRCSPSNEPSDEASSSLENLGLEQTWFQLRPTGAPRSPPTDAPRSPSPPTLQDGARETLRCAPPAETMETLWADVQKDIQANAVASRPLWASEPTAAEALAKIAANLDAGIENRVARLDPADIIGPIPDPESDLNLSGAGVLETDTESEFESELESEVRREFDEASDASLTPTTESFQALWNEHFPSTSESESELESEPEDVSSRVKGVKVDLLEVDAQYSRLEERLQAFESELSASDATWCSEETDRLNQGFYAGHAGFQCSLAGELETDSESEVSVSAASESDWSLNAEELEQIDQIDLGSASDFSTTDASTDIEDDGIEWQRSHLMSAAAEAAFAAAPPPVAPSSDASGDCAMTSAIAGNFDRSDEASSGVEDTAPLQSPGGGCFSAPWGWDEGIKGDAGGFDRGGLSADYSDEFYEDSKEDEGITLTAPLRLGGGWDDDSEEEEGIEEDECMTLEQLRRVSLREHELEPDASVDELMEELAAVECKIEELADEGIAWPDTEERIGWQDASLTIIADELAAVDAKMYAVAVVLGAQRRAFTALESRDWLRAVTACDAALSAVVDASDVLDTGMTDTCTTMLLAKAAGHMQLEQFDAAEWSCTQVIQVCPDVVGRGHASLLTNLDTGHSAPLRSI
jgi:hypothetical protein